MRTSHPACRNELVPLRQPAESLEWPQVVPSPQGICPALWLSSLCTTAWKGWETLSWRKPTRLWTSEAVSCKSLLLCLPLYPLALSPPDSPQGAFLPCPSTAWPACLSKATWKGFIELRLSGLVASTFPHWAMPQALSSFSCLQIIRSWILTALT